MIQFYRSKRQKVFLSNKRRVFHRLCLRLRLYACSQLYDGCRGSAPLSRLAAMPPKHLIKTGLMMFLVFLFGNAGAQSISPAAINSGGGSYTGRELIYEWSIGELALVETMISSEAGLTNGLLQPVLPAQILTNGFIVYAANVLTPNGDGSNDTWVIKDLERYPDNEIRIFDRAGRLVYYAKAYQNDWKGTVNGAPLAEDSYYYIITLTKDGRQSVPIKGFITIIH